MTKKDYAQFANMVSVFRKLALSEPKPDLGYIVACNDFAFSMADIFKSDNPRFNQERFLKACGIE